MVQDVTNFLEQLKVQARETLSSLISLDPKQYSEADLTKIPLSRLKGDLTSLQERNRKKLKGIDVAG